MRRRSMFLDPSDGVFGRFDLAALCSCHTLNVWYVCYAMSRVVTVRLLRSMHHTKVALCV